MNRLASRGDSAASGASAASSDFSALDSGSTSAAASFAASGAADAAPGRQQPSRRPAHRRRPSRRASSPRLAAIFRARRRALRWPPSVAISRLGSNASRPTRPAEAPCAASIQAIARPATARRDCRRKDEPVGRRAPPGRAVRSWPPRAARNARAAAAGAWPDSRFRPGSAADALPRALARRFGALGGRFRLGR